MVTNADAGAFPSSQRRGGCAERSEAQTGWPVRRKRFAGLLLRHRPVGLALGATPSAPLRWLRDIFLMAQPPLLCEEGNAPEPLSSLFLNRREIPRPA